MANKKINGGKAGSATMSSRTKMIISAIVAIFLVLVSLLTVGCNNSKGGVSGSGYSYYDNVSDINEHSNKTLVGVSGEILGNVDRQTTEVKNGGGFADNKYPIWGRTVNLSTDERNKMITESWNLCTINTRVGSDGFPKNTYNSMDAEGYLYLNGKKIADGGSGAKAGVPEKLYKHTSAASNYGGGLKDSEPAVIKSVKLRSRGYDSYSVTGLYAPAGEVVKVELTEADMAATGGVTIHIGQLLYNTKANNIWSARAINRMPVLLNTMVVNKTTAKFNEETGMWTAYVGNFLGGPIYVHNTKATVTLKISGAVEYRHFILGYTTEEEFERTSKSSAPYFDLEVWDHGVLHSGPVSYAKRFSYEDLYKAAVLWEKIAINANRVSSQGIVFLYDCFVAAGAAVAFPGQRSVNCPAGWMTEALNYSSFVTSGSWGNMHEYHHNFQNYGTGSGADGEVTNNGLNLVDYSLFTKISSARGILNYGAAGMSGWNTYTSATWALNRVNTGAITSTNGLALYATVLHNFGQNVYISSTGARSTSWYNKLRNNTHYNFSYFSSLVSNYGGGGAGADDARYPMFVPVSSVYQTGRTYDYRVINGDDVTIEKREIKTMQPYIIPFGKSFTVDLNPYTVEGGQYRSGSVIIAKDFKYTIKSVDASNANGTFVETETPGIYSFTPTEEIDSGKIYVTLELTTLSGAKIYNGCVLDDVDLILEFQQSKESSKTTLERTTYTYDSAVYSDAEAAYKANFAGYTKVEEYNHANPTQNANTDIWYAPENNSLANGKPAYQVMKFTDNKVEVIDGKLYFNGDGKYRIYMRGRWNCALYYSIDGKDYTVGATIKDSGAVNNSAAFRLSDPNTYFDIQFTTQSDGKTRTVTIFSDENDKTGRVISNNYVGDRWLYLREVLISTPLLNSATSFKVVPYIGVGSAQWTEPMFTMTTTYYDKDGNLLTDPTDPNIDPSKTVTKYFKNGVEVSEKEAEDKSLVAPTSANYANAYRRNYEFQKQFESDYFYTKTFNYSYNNTIVYNNKNATILSCNYEGNEALGFNLENICDGNTSTAFFSKTQLPTNPKGQDKNGEKNPFEIVVDLGEVITANYVTLYCYNSDFRLDQLNNGMPSEFVLYASLDGENFEKIYSPADDPNFVLGSGNMTYNFEARQMRYYKLIVTKTASYNSWLAVKEIQFHYNTVNVTGKNNFFSPDNSRFIYTGYWKFESVSSSFGHVYVGAKNSVMKFEFEGTYFGILSSKLYDNKFEVYVDGRKVDSVGLKPDNGDYRVAYMSQKLTTGKHSVEIKCLEESSIDSIITFA